MVRPHQQNALRCQRVKPQRAAADKIPKPVLIQCFQHPVKPLCQRRKLLRRNRPMPREADGNVLSPVLLRRKHVGNMAAGNVGKRLMQRSGRLERRTKPAVADLSLAVQHVFFLLTASVAVHLQHGKECLAGHLHRAELPHSLLALFLLFQQLFLSADVAAVALCQHVLAHRLDGFTRDDLAA